MKRFLVNGPVFLVVIAFLLARAGDVVGNYYLNMGALELVLAETHHFDNEIRMAITNLKSAISWQPDAPEPYHLLGRAFLYDWRVVSATESIQTFSQLIADEQWARTELNFVRCVDLLERNGDAAVWRSFGVTGNEFTGWFGKFVSVSELWNDDVALATCRELPVPILLDNTTLLTGDDLLGRIEDEKLIVRPCYGEGNVLVMYSSRTIEKVIAVEEGGDYMFDLYALRSFPPPVIISIMADYDVWRIFEYGSGDRTWSRQSQTIFLEEGLHLLSVSFVNDGRVEDQGQSFDRNAYISSLSIRRLD